MSRAAELSARDDEIAKELGVDKVPQPRYTNLPKSQGRDDIHEIVNFKKCLMLIDPLLTAAFEKYIPYEIVIDQAMSARNFVRGSSYLCHTRTDIPPLGKDLLPVIERKITAATGIKNRMDESGYYPALANQVLYAYRFYGARKMSPPLIFRTTKLTPFLGAVVLFDRTPPDGLTQVDIMSRMAVLDPPKIPDGETP